MQLLDASIAGVRVAHQNPLPAVGATCRVMFQSEFGPISVDCEVVRTDERPPVGFSDPPTYESGLRVLSADRQSQERLREMIATTSTRQKRNNNGNH